MDQKAVHVLTVDKGERQYSFTMPLHAPVGEAYDALFECLVEIKNHAEKLVETAERKEEDKKEEPKAE